MDDFYLKNAARYHTLVNERHLTLKPRVSTGKASSNMSVSTRIRPLSEDEAFPSAIFPRSNQENVVDIHDLYNHPRGAPVLKTFTYQLDRLFDTGSTTEDIFEDVVADLIAFAWVGGIGTLFAYGQTGSGKTFTISRLEHLVADTLMGGSLQGKKEVYMTIIDLAGKNAFDLLNKRAPVSLLEDSFGDTQMVGANEILVESKEKMKELIDHASNFRRTAPTLKNDASSRSHAICRMRIRDITNSSDGLLYLIDLAGSEGARDVSVHGAERMREAKEINVSLSALKDCIRGKNHADILMSSDNWTSGMKVPHVPHRRSPLTKVLKHVFDPASTRACKTAVIACVNPSLADVGPSKNTLRFAEMLRVLNPANETPDLDPMAPTNWSNLQVKEWIQENRGIPPIVSKVLAPRESGTQLLNLSTTEFEYRCQKCPGVKLEQARALRLKLWKMHIDAQSTSDTLKKTDSSGTIASTPSGSRLELRS